MLFNQNPKRKNPDVILWRVYHKDGTPEIPKEEVVKEPDLKFYTPEDGWFLTKKEALEAGKKETTAELKNIKQEKKEKNSPKAETEK
jgi:hypothetical protein